MTYSASDYAVDFSSLSKFFGAGSNRAKVLKGITLKIEKNQIFGLLGPNGAGKTTLIYILSGLLNADEGKVNVLGLDPRAERQKLAGRINLCTGNTSFQYLFTPPEILKYYGLLYGMSDAKIKENTERLISELGISDFRHKEFQELSTGMKQKVALAKALINDPELLFLDEPTLGLDVEVARDMRRYIRNIVKSKKMTIILTSHYLFEVEELCSNIAVINKGEIISSGTTRQVKDVADVGYTLVATLGAPCESAKFLEKIPGVRKTDISGMELTVYLGGSPSTVEKVISEFRRQKLPVVDFEVRKPTLEEAFLRLIKKGR